MKSVNELVDNYYTYLKDQTTITKDPDSEWVQISLPLLNPFNDPIDIFFKKADNDLFVLNDDGETLRYLELTSTKISNLQTILMTNEVLFIDGELTVMAKEENFSERLHSLVKTISECYSHHEVGLRL